MSIFCSFQKIQYFGQTKPKFSSKADIIADGHSGQESSCPLERVSSENRDDSSSTEAKTMESDQVNPNSKDLHKNSDVKNDSEKIPDKPGPRYNLRNRK